MSKTFTCAHCGTTFESDRPDGEAAAEAKELWDIDDIEAADVAVICDDCFCVLTEGAAPAHETLH